MQFQVLTTHMIDTASSSSSNTQFAPHLQDLSAQDPQGELTWPTVQPGWMLSYMNNFPVSSLDDYSATLLSDVADPSTDNVKNADEPACATESATSTAGPESVVASTAEATESDDGSSLAGFDQYETCMYQLSRLQSALYRMLLAPTEIKSREYPSEGFQSPTGVNAAAAGLARIDEAFAATQTMVEILDELSSLYNSQSSPTTNSGWSYSARRGRTLSLSRVDDHGDNSLRSLPSCPPPELGKDTAAILPILTCYLRLLHVYEGHTVSLQQCLRQINDQHPQRSSGSSSAPLSITAHDSHESLPAFRIGSFSFATSTNFNTHLLLHTVKHMLGRIQTAVQVCVPSASTSSAFSYCIEEDTYGDPLSHSHDFNTEIVTACPHDPMGSVVNAALSEMRHKESSLMRILHTLKEHHR